MCSSISPSRSRTKAWISQHSKDSRAEHISTRQRTPISTDSARTRSSYLARSMARLLPSAVAAVAITAAVLVAGLPAAWAASPAADDAPPYRNHTVGSTDGWFFNVNTNATSGNYSDWAAGETFYLGDYLSMSFMAPLAITVLLLCQFSTELACPCTLLSLKA